MTKITTQQILVMAAVLAIVPVTSAYATTCLPDQPCCDPMQGWWNCKITIPEYDFDFRIVPVCDPRIDPTCPSCPVCLDDYKLTEAWKDLKLDTTIQDKFDSFNADKFDYVNKFQKP